MAILISKSKAQSKGAMTRQATANSTFIASLFILEDTMKQETCLKNKMSYSRRKARRFWKQTYSDLPRDIIVHHKDGDPFNNNPDNLTIMENGEHLSYHASISDKKAMNNDKLLLKLESLLTIFNDR